MGTLQIVIVIIGLVVINSWINGVSSKRVVVAVHATNVVVVIFVGVIIWSRVTTVIVVAMISVVAKNG